jgi:hypothetical protein
MGASHLRYKPFATAGYDFSEGTEEENVKKSKKTQATFKESWQ